MAAADLKLALPLCERFHSELTASEFDAVWKANWLRNFIANASNLGLVACKERLVGYLLAETSNEEHSGVRFLHVREIFVEFGSRLLGCGTMLMSEARIQARRLQCGYITVKVQNGKPSAGFFNGLGFLSFSTEYRAET
jgi:GNAT superfamily N-acetyltransferase